MMSVVLLVAIVISLAEYLPFELAYIFDVLINAEAIVL